MSSFPPLHGQEGNGSGVPGPIGPYAVWGDSEHGEGVLGNSRGGDGVFGMSTQGQGVVGIGYSYGVSGQSNSGTGVSGSSTNGVGMYGESSNSGYNFGVVGKAPNAGVVAFNSNNNNAAYLASGCCAAYFVGEVAVIGHFSKSSGGFQIDHPLDPDNKYLFHSFVESSEMKNIYDGVTIIDANGEAVVDLPAWFEVLNTDFRYQLTSIGAPGPNLYIAEEISNNRFKIAGGTPMMKVSWQVTGIRQDAWVKAHPMKVEEEKSVEERGYYLHPELYGAPKEKSIERIRHPQQTQQTP